MDIPILGQPGRVLSWYPTALAQCLCQEGEPVILALVGFGSASACPRCGKVYVLRSIEPGPNGLNVQVDIREAAKAH